MGFQPVPLTSNAVGQIPNVADLLTPEELEESKKEHNDDTGRPVNYIRDHPDFWTPERLEKEAYRFINVATTMGKSSENNTYSRDELDIDSEPVYEKLKDFIENTKDKTIIVKTKKPFGYRIYWWEETTHKNIIKSHCRPDHQFEIKCESGISTLPPSCHRDDEQFGYSFYGNAGKVEVIDGLYNKLTEVALKDFLVDGWNKEKDDAVGGEVNLGTYVDLNEDQIMESFRKLKPLYVKGYRNPFVYELSGLAFNNRISLASCLDIVKQLARATIDEEARSRMVVVKNTYHNGELGRKISGYSGLVRLITSTKKDMDRDSAENFIKDFIKEVWSVSDGKKIGSNSKRKTNRKSKMMSEKQKKISKCFKYSDNGRIKPARICHR